MVRRLVTKSLDHIRLLSEIAVVPHTGRAGSQARSVGEKGRVMAFRDSLKYIRIEELNDAEKSALRKLLEDKRRDFKETLDEIDKSLDTLSGK